MSTLAEIRSYVRVLTLLETDDITDAEVDDFINQGLRELGSLYPWPFLQAETTITLLDAQAEYALPADFNRLEVVIGDGGEELDETTRRRAQDTYLGGDNGTPEVFYLWKEQIVFAPTPSATPEFSTVVIDYLREPTELSADPDVPEFYSAYHMLLAVFAASKMWEREEDFERADYYYRRFRGGALSMMSHYKNRSKDAPFIIGGGEVDARDPQRPFMTWLQPFGS